MELKMKKAASRVGAKVNGTTESYDEASGDIPHRK